MQRPHGWAYRLGDKQLNVHGPGVKPAEVARLPVQPGNSDLCFEWLGPIDDAIAHLKEHGIAIECGPMQRFGAKGPGTSVYFRDPDGSLMHEMREELDDLAFRELYPEACEVVTARLNALTERSRLLISDIEKQLTKKLADRGIDARVVGRRKRAYSIWRKMERKSVGFEQLSDIFGFRVIVKSLADCYQALGIVHSTWPMVPGRFKDYISTPKGNDYRSIHTTVIGPSKQRVELQIRTVGMRAEGGGQRYSLMCARRWSVRRSLMAAITQRMN